MNVNLGRTTLTVDPTTQSHVWTALSANAPFPDRAITIGGISAQSATKKPNRSRLDAPGGIHQSSLEFWQRRPYQAMLELRSLKLQHSLDISTHLSGGDPGPDQVLVSQTIVSV